MKTTSQSYKVGFVLLLLLLLAASFFASAATSGHQFARAQAAVDAIDTASPDGSHTCAIDNLAVYSVRIQVRCTTGVGPLYNFAAPFSSSAESRQTNRLLAMLITAKTLNKPVVVYYNDDPLANPNGCIADDCRRLEGVVLQQ